MTNMIIGNFGRKNLISSAAGRLNNDDQNFDYKTK